MKGKINNIFISEKPGKKMQSIQSASVISGKGIEGDRYFTGQGTFSEKLKDNPAVQLSLIEKEEIDNFNKVYNQTHEYGDFRRNIVTEGIRLNDLVDKTFKVGNMTLKGIRLCEPCQHLADTVNKLVLPYLVGRGGLRAEILSSSQISVGDIIQTN